MNVEFIPVFYGAFSETTAVTEIQPYEDELIAVGKFTLSRPLQIFDFTFYNKKYNKTPAPHSRIYEINKIINRISKPISPSTKAFEYIPTQVIADYLKAHFKVDGIIYPSSWFRGEKNNITQEDTRNIVLFNTKDKLSIGEEDVHLRRVKSAVYTVETEKLELSSDWGY